MENPCKIITFGDSITKGYTDLFRDKITKEYTDVNIEVVNAGVIGDTSTHGLMRIQDIIDQKPNVVIVGFGMNDWRKGVSLEFFKQNMRSIIDRLEKNNVRVILATINPDYRGFLKGTSRIIDKYNVIIMEVAYEKRIRIADINSLWKRKIIPLKRGLSDAIHPNNLGYGTICKSLMRVVPRRNTTIVWQYSGEHCACNYKCPYCYVPNDVNVGDHFIGSIEKWHDAFKKAFGNQHLTFYISFGEPMVQKHFYEVVEMIESEPNWEMMMTSNLSMSLDRLLKSRLVKDGRLNINASFHPTETTIDNFLKQLLCLRANGIESPVIYVMWPEIMSDFNNYFQIFNKNNFLVHVRRFRGYYKGKYYPRDYTAEERQFVAKYMDSASIKYMLSDAILTGKSSYVGMYHIVVTNDGDVTPTTDYMQDRRRGNVLQGTVRLDIDPQPFMGVIDGTVDGIAALLEIGYHELFQNHVITFAKQGGVYHTDKGIHYPHLDIDFNNPVIRKQFNFPGFSTKTKKTIHG